MPKNTIRSTALEPLSDEPLDVLARQLNEYKHQEQQEILGKILTIVDATVTQPQQNKAMKDLIKSAVNTEIGYWHGTNALLGHWAQQKVPDLVISKFIQEQMPKYGFDHLS